MRAHLSFQLALIAVRTVCKRVLWGPVGTPVSHIGRFDPQTSTILIPMLILIPILILILVLILTLIPIPTLILMTDTVHVFLLN